VIRRNSRGDYGHTYYKFAAQRIIIHRLQFRIIVKLFLANPYLNVTPPEYSKTIPIVQEGLNNMSTDCYAPMISKPISRYAHILHLSIFSDPRRCQQQWYISDKNNLKIHAFALIYSFAHLSVSRF
jgi:hypothetical protein